MEIIIKPVANPGLYRDIQEGINARATKHRTISGAFRGLQLLNRRARNWARSCGQWGNFEVWVDGERVDGDDFGYLLFTLEDRNPLIAHERLFGSLIEEHIAKRALK